MRWGKNIETGQRRASRRAGAATYSSASALETLVSFQSLVLIYGALHYSFPIYYGFPDANTYPSHL